MFTGIVRERGRVASFDGARLVLEHNRVQAAVGDSIALDGVCLTVVAGDEATLAFDVVPETLARVDARSCRPATVVNVEPALRLGEELGGHLVQGHVDGVGRVRGRARGRWTARLDRGAARQCCATASRRARSPFRASR